MRERYAFFLLGIILTAIPANGYIVVDGLKVDEIVKQSDVIFKGTVLSTGPNKDPNPPESFLANNTQFKVISLIKSPGPLDLVNFQHYEPEVMMMGPGHQHYHFEVGKTYLICAKHTDVSGFYQQLWTYHTLSDSSVTLCANESPLTAKTFPEALLSELCARLPGSSDQDALHLIADLDRLSGGGSHWRAQSVFDRNVVMAAGQPFIANSNPEIAQNAIRLIGSASPYLTDDETLKWLNAHAAVKIINVDVRDPQKKNIGGDRYRNEILAVATGKSDAATRALAILALGQLSDPAFEAPIQQWLADPSPVIRRSATLLRADFPKLATTERLEKLTVDSAPEVRVTAAATMGILQQPEKADLLAKLLDDHDPKVRQAAVISLVTFSPKNEKIAAIFHANIDRSEFAPIFFNAIVLDDPASHLDGLAKVIAHNTEPDNPWIGETPHLLAWEILLDYLQAQPVDQLKSGKFDASLDALGKVAFVSDTISITQARGLHHHESSGLIEMEGECNINNISVPAIVYAFYLQHGMIARAKKYRLWTMKTCPSLFAENLGILFQNVAEDPSLYKRE